MPEVEASVDTGEPVEHLAAMVLVALPSAVLVTDEEGRVLFVNARAAEILGKTGSELVRTNVKRLFGDTEAGEGDVRLSTKVRRNGEVITLGYTVSKVAMPEGRVLSAISFRDISDTVRLTQERDRLLQLAAVGEAMPTLLHELRNPLAAILTTVELLIEDTADDARRDSLHAVLTEARRIALQLDGVGAVGRSLRSRRATAIDFACRDICLLMVGRAEKAEVHLKWDIPDLPLLPLDSATMRAVLFNLVTNAIHACPPQATVCVHMRLVHGGSDLEVTVVDNGAGMSAEVYARCSDLFFTTKRHGSGIGLALCRRAVEDAGGRMEIQSVPGAGTAVVLTIPVGRKVDADSEPPPSDSSQRRRHGLEK